ncbi:hypothetical protein SynBIOSE41_01741 [Synechococcus sp. BIOS-E4-1]|nr:hypothetical protein SynBIOSE41_01741 [Synechococcus sp. BIOS-E4-1]
MLVQYLRPLMSEFSIVFAVLLFLLSRLLLLELSLLLLSLAGVGVNNALTAEVSSESTLSTVPAPSV